MEEDPSVLARLQRLQNNYEVRLLACPYDAHS